MSEIIDTNKLGEEIVEVLKSIYDPEIPVDIYELGLIYDVFVNEDYEVKNFNDFNYSKLSSSRDFTFRG